LVFVALYFVAKSVFTILSWIAPLLLLGAAIIDYTVILDYGKWLLKLLKENLMLGVGAVLLTVFGFPVIAGFLFGKAWLYRKMKGLKAEYETKTQGEYSEYEEIVEEKPETLELPPLPKEPLPKREKLGNQGNEYDQLFD